MDAFQSNLEAIRQLGIALTTSKMVTTAPLCINCKYNQSPSSRETYFYSRCTHPNSIDPERGTAISCIAMRMNVSACGWAGTLWVSK